MSEQPDTTSDRTAVDEAAQADHDAVAGDVDRAGPIDDDAMASAEGLTVSGDVAAEYDDMLERGAHQEGEGRVP